MIKVSDYIIQFLKEKGVDTAFCVSGGAAAHLMDSLRSSGIKVIHNYHEQACAMAADAYARITNKPALVLVTNGPGSSNAITGVLGAFQDSIPMFVLSGQVPTHQTMHSQLASLRQLGLQEADIISMVRHCTNYSIQIQDYKQTQEILNEAWDAATSHRKGPVWIDVPIDVQAEKIEVKEIEESISHPIDYTQEIIDIFDRIQSSKKPLIIVGNGVHLSGCEKEFLQFVNNVRIPVVSTWNASDIFDFNDPLYVGNFGLIGQRAANFAVQNADLILLLGSRLSIPCTGYNTKEFAKNAYKIMVDIDCNEMLKSTLSIDRQIEADLTDFLPQIASFDNHYEFTEWKQQTVDWKWQYSVYNEKHTREEGFVNSYDFMEHLSSYLKPKDVIVTDMGTSFTCTMQALMNIGSNRLFTSSALCSMGFGLPGAIGASLADPDARVICIAGDGGFQMNIQELQTVAHYQLPIKIIVLNNNGYLAISLMQDNLFAGKRFGADEVSGVSAPDFYSIAKSYKIPSIKLKSLEDVNFSLKQLLDVKGPLLIEVNMVRDQLLIPRVQSKKDKDGKIVSGSLDVMFPFID